MSDAYWKAKIWGLLHDPAFKPLHNNTGRGGNSFWRELPVMQDWVEGGLNPEESGKKILEHIKLADYITSASDRGAIGSVTSSVNYNENGLEISHLLSGEKQIFKLKDDRHRELISDRKRVLEEKENNIFQLIPESIKNDPNNPQKLFWWLWRCLPEAVCQEFDDFSLLLTPAETRLPDSSIWSHASLTAAMAGALAGYDLTTEEIKETWKSNKPLSHAYIASFTFSPIQELIKASRKMRDFWAGSWILHYLSAKVCWELAKQYGADCILYPSLYQQPLIDLWLLKECPEFQNWLERPSDRALLTAGFPNVIVLVLPKDKVNAAMQRAKQVLVENWREIGKLVFKELEDRNWQPNLNYNSNTWKGWLESQWQTYWTAVPIGKEGEELKNAAIPKEREEEFQQWLNTQNQAYAIETKNDRLFQKKEINFLREAYQQRLERQGRKFSVNVGSWWNHAFDQTRLALTAVKNARDWEIPTAFSTRSTISGIGSVVHPPSKKYSNSDWITEGEVKQAWTRQAGLFDGREQLNATETVKRVLEKILPQLLDIEEEEIADSYPDLTAGVAGYLKVHTSDRQHQTHFDATCEAIIAEYPWAKRVIEQMRNKWGIPWIKDSTTLQKYHPRLLNAGWLIEDAEIKEIKAIEQKLERQKDLEIIEQLNREIRDIKNQYRSDIQVIIDRHYPNNNPADWYVLAAGDGDDLSKWLKGEKLKPYRDYIPAELTVKGEIQQTFEEFLDVTKRMGPSTHNALSRALLDFSNQLVPYLTEQRYAGRLIYSGGDDVLAYTNLWEWDNWLWDIRQCFRGDRDPQTEFSDRGDYWHWDRGKPPAGLADRPLFTMGSQATISFGIVIAHHSVPLAIALENLWEAEKEGAKKHKSPDGKSKDAVQVRIIYGNGNILKATTKFDVFHQWQQLLNQDVESSIFEQAANVWNQHPVPSQSAIIPWTKAFCSRREQLQDDEIDCFQQALATFINNLWLTTEAKDLDRKDLDREVLNWLKLAAFVMRKRDIKLGGQ